MPMSKLKASAVLSMFQSAAFHVPAGMIDGSNVPQGYKVIIASSPKAGGASAGIGSEGQSDCFNLELAASNR